MKEYLVKTKRTLDVVAVLSSNHTSFEAVRKIVRHGRLIDADLFWEEIKELHMKCPRNTTKKELLDLIHTYLDCSQTVIEASTK